MASRRCPASPSWASGAKRRCALEGAGPAARTCCTVWWEGRRPHWMSQAAAISRSDMPGTSARRSTIRWRIGGGKPRGSSTGSRRCLANRPGSPARSNRSARRSTVRACSPVARARSPAASPKITTGRISVYMTCSGHCNKRRNCAQSSVRSWLARLRFDIPDPERSSTSRAHVGGRHYTRSSRWCRDREPAVTRKHGNHPTARYAQRRVPSFGEVHCEGPVRTVPVLGGLHHRYERAA